MGNLSQLLGKWTPYSVIIIMIVTTMLSIVIWYAFHYMTPPDWVINFLTAIGFTGAYGFGHITGTVSANGVAKDAVSNVIGAAHTNATTTANQGN